MATALHSTRTRFFDKCGKPLCGGTVHTYQASTTTAKPTYTDVNKTAVNTNPVILDSIGSAAIFLDGAYRVRVLDRNGVLVEDIAYIESWVSATEKDKIYENITTNKSLINTHINKLDNPHKVTKAQVELGNVDNTADIDKPISKAVSEALTTKADIADTYTKNETDNKISTLSATTYAGHKGYITLAKAQAAQASLAVNTLVEVTNDSDASKNGVYLWDGTTLIKSNNDVLGQAKAYTDSQFTFNRLGNLYDSASTNVKSGFYADTGGTVTANADSILYVLSVEAGKTYAIKSSSFNSSYFFVGLKNDNNVAAGQTSTITTLSATSDANVKTFTVPSNSTAKYALINLKVGTSWDVRSGFIINEGTTATDTSAERQFVANIKGVNIVDIDAQSRLKTLESNPAITTNDLTINKRGNLYHDANNVSGYYITINTGEFSTNADSIVAVIPIIAGKTYAIKSPSFNTSYFAALLKNDNVVGSGTGTNVTNSLATTSDSTVKTLTIDSASTAKYLMLNIKVATSFDIRSGLVVNEGNSITDSSAYTEEVTKVKTYQVRDDVARTLIAQVDAKASNSIASPLKSKSWVVVGDSITEVNFRTNKNYHAYVSDYVGGMTIYNYGQSGSGFYSRYDVANTITQDPDYVTVFFGTNDWQNSDPNNTKLLGQFGDTTSETIAGCVYLTLSQLVSKYYNRKIAVFTPLPRSDNWGSKAAANSRGFTLEQLVNVIKQTAEHFSLPCLDLYHRSNLPVWLTAGNNYYFTAPGQSSPDGLHPNDAGHQVIAAKVKAFLESI